MKLGYETIKKLLHGVVYTEEKDGKIFIHRFTHEQEEAYREYSPALHKKCFSTAGVRMEFDTDSTKLDMSFDVQYTSGTHTFVFDVCVDGNIILRPSICEEDDSKTVDLSFSANLGEGKKRVAVYFPWMAKAVIKSMYVDDGSYIQTVTRPHTMISFGDSITHGYTAYNPSRSYASLLADALRADALNKGIGAEVFFPALAKLKDSIEPDYITVAYGTNDWSLYKSKEDFEKNCREFYKALSANYPNSKIFAITPIWRGNWDDKAVGCVSFSYIGEYIGRVAAELPNVTVINGFDLVPHEECFFMEDVLHPNTEGFRHYANNLYSEIKKHI